MDRLSNSHDMGWMKCCGWLNGAPTLVHKPHITDVIIVRSTTCASDRYEGRGLINLRAFMIKSGFARSRAIGSGALPRPFPYINPLEGSSGRGVGWGGGLWQGLSPQNKKTFGIRNRLAAPCVLALPLRTEGSSWLTCVLTGEHFDAPFWQSLEQPPH